MPSNGPFGTPQRSPAGSDVDASTAHIARLLRQGAIGVGVLMALAGALALVGGWWLGIAPLRQPLPAFDAMMAATALGLLASGVGVVAAGMLWPKWVVWVSGVIPGVLLARQSASDGSPGLLFCDLDHFKYVNDRYGHAIGDEVLRVSAHRMATALRGDDVAARLGGDEFVVVLGNVADQAAASSVAEKIRHAVSEPLAVGAEGFVNVTMSVGIALAAPEASAHRLLRNADAALYQAKRSGRDRIAVLDDVATARAEIDVRDGIASRQFVPWYQPIVNLATGELSGYEALARRVRSDGSINLPANFLMDAERSSLIGGLDLAVLKMSLERLARIESRLYIAVNVSPTTLASPDNTRRMIEAVDSSGIDPTRLHLELTEAALLGTSDTVRDAMCDFAGFGIRWYVDDFGTGYSSISHLRDLPIAGLKLDQSFTAGVGSGDIRGEQLARALASLTNSLGLDGVAEGVQTVAQAEILRAEGWLHGQGWLFGRPMPATTPVQAA